jgi:ribulose-5-phosphate 4-epimerase/fuculose-1-phosphate aldolase
LRRYNITSETDLRDADDPNPSLRRPTIIVRPGRCIVVGVLRKRNGIGHSRGTIGARKLIRTSEAKFSVSGLHPWVDETIRDLAHFGRTLGVLGCVPGNGGDISVLVPEEVAKSLRATLPTGIQVPYAELSRLRDIRRDDRPYYRAQGQLLDELDLGTTALNGRLLFSTTSGAKIWDLDRDPDRYLCFTTVEHDHFVLHDRVERTPVPTTEFMNHVAGHATNMTSSNGSSTVVHAHPQHVIDLSRHPRTKTFATFNYQIYTQRIEQLANIPELLGFVLFALPGSGRLAKNTAEAFKHHRGVVWQAHGIIVREQTIERCVDLIQYTETAAAAALTAFTHGTLWSPSREQFENFLSMYQLSDDFLQLLDEMEQK